MKITYEAGRASNRVGVLLGLAFAGVCVWMAMLARHDAVGPTFVFLPFGSLWLSIAGLSWLSLTDPIRLVSGEFDDERARFVLTAADGTSCALSYRELDSFGVRRKVSSGKHKHVSYVVYLLKRDAGFWDLQSFADEGEANQLLARLRGSVNLRAASPEGDPLAGPLPDAFSREDVGAVTRFSWRNHDRLVDSLCGILLGGSIVAMLFGVVGIIAEARIFCQLLAGMVVAWIARRTYKAKGRTFQIEIGDRFLTYSTRDRGEADFQVRRVLSVEDVTRLQSVYELARTDQERSHQLTFVGDLDAARLQDRRFERGTRETLRAGIALDQSIIELDLPGIRTSDVLKFEACLQRELATRGRSVA